MVVTLNDELLRACRRRDLDSVKMLAKTISSYVVLTNMLKYVPLWRTDKLNWYGFMYELIAELDDKNLNLFDCNKKRNFDSRIEPKLDYRRHQLVMERYAAAHDK